MAKHQEAEWIVHTHGATNVQNPQGRIVSFAIEEDGSISLRFLNEELTWSTGVVLDTLQLAELQVAAAQVQAQLIRDVMNSNTIKHKLIGTGNGSSRRY